MVEMAYGLVGSLLGNWIVLALGVSVGAGLIAAIVVASIGATILIGAQRMVRHVRA
jgi:uncharacterized membrane protein YeaQ/YmgE (transglycosylase-associated protein family)